MGTPKRTSIFLDLRTTLATISVANGYKTDVVLNDDGRVDDGIKPLCDVPSALRPYVGWWMGVERAAQDAFDNQVWRIPITLAGYVWITDISDWAARSASINNLLDDLIAVVSVDPSRSCFAMDTWIIGTETNETEGECAKNDGWCIVDMEIEYERTTESS